MARFRLIDIRHQIDALFKMLLFHYFFPQSFFLFRLLTPLALLFRGFAKGIQSRVTGLELRSVQRERGDCISHSLSEQGAISYRKSCVDQSAVVTRCDQTLESC